jgi:D-alanyl-lipoteichoic acid acyltransferase DltB (MBOAT superfamily)
VIANYLATEIVDRVFASPGRHSSLELLIGVYGYAVQIYADFSGYTDMAIGLALLLGFRFPQNFDSPYAADSLQDFWRRCHMTLSRWLRDYLYIPLGGNRQGKRRGYVNLAITMILGGLWHGAAWTFVVWGSLHGVGLAVERWRADVRRNRPPEVIEAEAAAQASRTGIDWPLWGRRALTFHLVCLGWVFFRAQTFTNAFQVLGRLFHFGMGTPFNPVLVGVIVGSIAVQYLPRDLSGKLRAAFSRSSWWAQTVLLSGFMVVTNALGPIGVAPFIYFKF